MSFKQQVQQDTGFGRSFIVKRVEWGSRPSPKPLSLPSAASFVIIHQTNGEASCTPLSNASSVRYQQRHDVDIQHLSDIAFNFLVGEDGKAYEGRGWGVEGEHADGMNRASIGIAVIGDFSDSVPNEEALDAIRALISMGISCGHIKEDYRLLLHKPIDNNNKEPGEPQGPGEQFLQELKTWPNFEE